MPMPTQERLRLLEDSNYDGIDFARFSFPMKSLRLMTDNIASHVVKSLSGRLESSNLLHLEVMDYCDQNIEGAECLLRVLPLTSIKSLNFVGSEIKDEGWCRLAPLFEKCGLETLLLGANEFSSTLVERLSVAIQTNQTLSELYLCTNEVATTSLEVLIQSFSNPSRGVKTKRIKLLTFPDEPMDSSTVKHLMDFATLMDCEFVHAGMRLTSPINFDLRSC